MDGRWDLWWRGRRGGGGGGMVGWKSGEGGRRKRNATLASQDMHITRPLSGEPLSTFTAFEWFQLLVHRCNVTIQVKLLPESFGTDLAAECRRLRSGRR
jgi:hypothetical protein